MNLTNLDLQQIVNHDTDIRVRAVEFIDGYFPSRVISRRRLASDGVIGVLQRICNDFDLDFRTVVVGFIRDYLGKSPRCRVRASANGITILLDEQDLII